MNLLLLHPEDFLAPDRVRIAGRRHRHLVDILCTAPGQPVKAGLLDGPLGTARVVDLQPDFLDLTVRLDTQPPSPAPVTLLLALPRPKVLRRILQTISACGVKRVVLLNTARVDKSYWQSPLLSPAAIREQLFLGLEQASDTLLPQVLLRPRFRPFVEDELPQMTPGTLCLAAHPGSSEPCPCAVTGAVTLAVGPEGGFVPFEVELLLRQGFNGIHLGPRLLRVETAVTALLGRLLPLC
jgi:RsmE family RNA methyltransferase